MTPDPLLTTAEVCACCGGDVTSFDGMVECWETTGELQCADCWDEQCDANAAYDREDAE